MFVTDMATGRSSLLETSTVSGDPNILMMALSPSGNELALTTDARNSEVRVLDLRSGRSRTLQAHGVTGTPFAIAYSPDGGRIAVGLASMPKVQVFDAQTGDQLSELTAADVQRGLAFAGPEYLVGVAVGGSLEVWNATTGQSLLRRRLTEYDSTTGVSSVGRWDHSCCT